MPCQTKPGLAPPRRFVPYLACQDLERLRGLQEGLSATASESPDRAAERVG